MESFDTLDRREEPMATLGDGGNRQQNILGIKYVTCFRVVYSESVMRAQLLEASTS